MSISILPNERAQSLLLRLINAIKRFTEFSIFLILLNYYLRAQRYTISCWWKILWNACNPAIIRKNFSENARVIWIGAFVAPRYNAVQYNVAAMTEHQWACKLQLKVNLIQIHLNSFSRRKEIATSRISLASILSASAIKSRTNHVIGDFCFRKIFISFDAHSLINDW